MLVGSEKKMKYKALSGNQKFTFLESDLTEIYPSFLCKWIDNDAIFLAKEKKEKAFIFNKVWSIDFFGEKDLLITRLNNPRKEAVEHYRYNEGQFQFLSSVGKDYVKVNSTTAILSYQEYSYLCNIITEKALSIPCDDIKIEMIEGSIFLKARHKLKENNQENQNYYLEYYMDETGQIVSDFLNTFRHTYGKIKEQEIYMILDEMREDVRETLKEEQLKLRKSIHL